MDNPLPPPLTADALLRVLTYDRDTGNFTWVGARRAGRIAGGHHGSYWGIGIGGKAYLAHRLAVLYMTGAWPPDGMTVDHIDGDPLNNCWTNLRIVSQAVNNQNLRRPMRRNRAGLLGAHWNEQERKWQSTVRVAGENIYLGRFATAQEAHEAYIEAKRQHHVGCTI